jgi:hypothetical protein
MSKAQIGSLSKTLLIAAAVSIAFGSLTFAQDAPVAAANPAVLPQAVGSPENQVTYAPQYAAPRYRHACCCGGGPYKGFYPCNGMTPYFGGACHVYGDAPLYTAPADYGHHCAAHCP